MEDRRHLQIFKETVQLVCVVVRLLAGYGPFDDSEAIPDQVVAKVTILVVNAPGVELVCWVYGWNELCDSRLHSLVALRGSCGDGRHV